MQTGHLSEAFIYVKKRWVLALFKYNDIIKLQIVLNVSKTTKDANKIFIERGDNNYEIK